MDRRMKYLLVTLTTAIVFVAGYFLLPLSSTEEGAQELSATDTYNKNVSTERQRNSVAKAGNDLTYCKSNAISYDFEYVSQGHYYDQMQASQANELTLNANGTITVECKKLTSGFEQTWYFPEATFSQSGRGMFSQVESPTEFIKGGMVVKVTLNENFEIQHIKTNPYDAMSRHLVKDILNWSRFTTGAGEQWQASEPDINGIAKSDYQIVAQRPNQVTVR